MKTGLPIKARKRGPKIRGVCADAASLDVNYNHLSLVLRGKRQSESLRKRYLELKKSQQSKHMDRTLPFESSDESRMPKPLKAIPFELQALDNLSPAFLVQLASLRVAIIVLQFEADKESPIWLHSAIADDLGEALIAIKAGYLDSSFWPLGKQYHFYHLPCARISAAAHRIKEVLAERGLLSVSKIYHVENAETLREFTFPDPAIEMDAKKDT